ncbi:MAG: 16S rRNA (guanine(966)-N(2))-methyltransferase RsmD [Lautropia sp.]|nr:16S rRNA (guanine(966)-N(2))-methyltransferase RsmD [Lautropia sp.]
MDSRVRIIGGRWKRMLLPVQALQGLRPTPDRVREALFNWLGQDLTGWDCLDLFAGTGVLGFEAASRGAARVTLIERDPKLARSLEIVKARLAAEMVAVMRADALAWLKSTPVRPHDLVLLDPPYHEGWLERLLPLLQTRLAPEGRVYAECEFKLTGEWLGYAGAGGLAVLRAARAGQVHYHLLGPRHPLLAAPGQAPTGEF